MAGLRMTGQSALIVLDMQQAVLEAAWDREGVVGRVGSLVRRARGEGVPVLYTQGEPLVAPSAIVRDAGWSIDPRIAPEPGDWVIARHYADAFASTPLADTLDAMDVTHLVIAGAETDHVVQASVHRALAEGWHVTLVADAHTAPDRAAAGGIISGGQIVSHANAALAFLEYPGRAVEVVPHDQVAYSVAVMQGAA